MVDNDRGTATTMLTMSGFRARYFLGDWDALASAAEDPPDAVLFDLSMPGMDGFELAHRLGKPAGGKRPLLVAVTGSPRAEDRQRADAIGIDEYFLKPADTETIVAILKRFAQPLGRPVVAGSVHGQETRGPVE